MRAAAEAGDVRMLFAVGPGFEEFEPGALGEAEVFELDQLEDAKAWVSSR